MKKISIFFSFLFLFFIAVSNDSFAQAVCGGTPANCSAIATGSAACTASGCATCGAGATGSPTVACSSLTTAATCQAVGCASIVSGDANNNAFVSTLCNALKIVTGNGGKAFAAFAIISCGIGFFTGKISWGLMIGITCGIAAMFGAPTIVAAIAGGNALDCKAV